MRASLGMVVAGGVLAFSGLAFAFPRPVAVEVSYVDDIGSDYFYYEDLVYAPGADCVGAHAAYCDVYVISGVYELENVDVFRVYYSEFYEGSCTFDDYMGYYRDPDYNKWRNETYFEYVVDATPWYWYAVPYTDMSYDFDGGDPLFTLVTRASTMGGWLYHEAQVHLDG